MRWSAKGTSFETSSFGNSFRSRPRKVSEIVTMRITLAPWALSALQKQYFRARGRRQQQCTGDRRGGRISKLARAPPLRGAVLTCDSKRFVLTRTSTGFVTTLSAASTEGLPAPFGRQNLQARLPSLGPPPPAPVASERWQALDTCLALFPCSCRQPTDKERR